MHPFDLQHTLLAKHAQHVVVIHFPIALFIAGVMFDFAGQFFPKPALKTAAYYNFVLAALSAPIAVATGTLAWQFQLEGKRLHGIILTHLLLGTASAVLILFVGWIHYKAARSERTTPLYRLPIEVLAVVIVALTGHLGGFLSGVNT